MQLAEITLVRIEIRRLVQNFFYLLDAATSRVFPSAPRNLKLVVCRPIFARPRPPARVERGAGWLHLPFGGRRAVSTRAPFPTAPKRQPKDTRPPKKSRRARPSAATGRACSPRAQISCLLSPAVPGASRPLATARPCPAQSESLPSGRRDLSARGRCRLFGPSRTLRASDRRRRLRDGPRAPWAGGPGASRPAGPGATRDGGSPARAPRRDLRVYRRRRRGEPGCKACRHDAAMLAGAVTAGIAYCCQCCVYTTKVDQASDGGCARLELRLKGFTRAGRAGRAGQRRIFAEAGAAGVRRCGGRGGPAGCWISRHETKNGNGGHGSDSRSERDCSGQG